MALLEATGLVGGYGETKVLRGCDICVSPGEIAVILGPNGAGKSSAMRAIFGLMKLDEGQVAFDQKDITLLAPQKRVDLGMAFVPQTENVFPSMTVQENLEMGAFNRRDEFQSTMESVYELFPILWEKRKQVAGELSGGQRQQAAVGRALMTRPRLLMLDEPTAGVSPLVMDDLFDRIRGIRDTGVAVLMVEQNARQALTLADRGYVLVLGRNRHEGTGKALIADAEVRRSFLGG